MKQPQTTLNKNGVEQIQLGVKINADNYMAVREIAKKTNRSLTAVVTEALEAFLKEN